MFLRSHPAFKFFQIFICRQGFRVYPSLYEQVADIPVVLDVFIRDRIFTVKIIFHHIKVRDLGREVLGGYRYGLKEIGKRPVLRDE